MTVLRVPCFDGQDHRVSLLDDGSLRFENHPESTMKLAEVMDLAVGCRTVLLGQYEYVWRSSRQTLDGAFPQGQTCEDLGLLSLPPALYAAFLQGWTLGLDLGFVHAARPDRRQPISLGQLGSVRLAFLRDGLWTPAWDAIRSAARNTDVTGWCGEMGISMDSRGESGADPFWGDGWISDAWCRVCRVPCSPLETHAHSEAHVQAVVTAAREAFALLPHE
jgi:hypothetical protein